MMAPVSRVSAVTLLFALQAQAASANLNASLALAIEEIIKRPEYEGCHWGIHARRTGQETDQCLVYENPSAHLFSTPASNNKLPTTYASWLALGPEYTFETFVGINSSGEDSNIIVTLCGANDPSLTTAQLQVAAAAVVKAVPELASASVSVRVDNRRSADALFPESWEWDDLEFYYGAPPTSVILDGNTVEVIVAPGATVGAAAVVTVPADPGCACFGLQTTAATTAAASSSSDAAAVSLTMTVVRGALQLVVAGSIEVGTPSQSFTIACRDPLRRATDLLAEALVESGATGAVAAGDASSVVSNAPECDDVNSSSAYVRVPMISAPLVELLNHTLLESDNTYAEAVLRRLGNDGSISQGLSTVRKILNQSIEVSPPVGLPVALNLEELSAQDGSGLSRHGLVMPPFLAALMAGADSDYLDLLPLAGVSGTLANRFIGTVAEGKLRAKTGSMSNVNSLTGVVGNVAFSILSDACPISASTVRQGIDDIAVLFAEQSSAAR